MDKWVGGMTNYLFEKGNINNRKRSIKSRYDPKRAQIEILRWEKAIEKTIAKPQNKKASLIWNALFFGEKDGDRTHDL